MEFWPINLSKNSVYQKQTSKMSSTIGIIYPPPELRTVVDTTAQYVAKNGEGKK